MSEAEFVTDVHLSEGPRMNPKCPPCDRVLQADRTPRRIEAGHLRAIYCPQCDSFHALTIPSPGTELPPSPLHLWE